jgi:hypothetical protein
LVELGTWVPPSIWDNHTPNERPGPRYDEHKSGAFVMLLPGLLEKKVILLIDYIRQKSDTTYGNNNN